MSGSRNESQEVIGTGRKGGDSLFKITRVDLSGVLFMLWHYVWRKDLARKRKAKEGLYKRKKVKKDKEDEERFRKVKKDLGRRGKSYG